MDPHKKGRINFICFHSFYNIAPPRAQRRQTHADHLNSSVKTPKEKHKNKFHQEMPCTKHLAENVKHGLERLKEHCSRVLVVGFVCCLLTLARLTGLLVFVLFVLFALDV